MKEFIAETPSLEIKVYELSKQFNGINGDSIRKKLNKLIQEDPHLIEAYNLRYEILDHEDCLVARDKEAKKAYEAVKEIILDENGNFPELLRWGFLENRPILTAIANYAITLWRSLKWEEAEELIKKMLTMNPNDNQGMRYYYLAVKERIAYRPFVEKFNQDDPNKLFSWFEKEAQKYELLKEYLEV